MELDKEFSNCKQSGAENSDCVKIGHNCKKIWSQS